MMQRLSTHKYRMQSDRQTVMASWKVRDSDSNGILRVGGFRIFDDIVADPTMTQSNINCRLFLGLSETNVHHGGPG